MNTTTTTTTATTAISGRGQRATWTAGLVVAAGAGVATADGLFRVAAAAQVPTAIGWLYPLITDGLALVAYAATRRLTTSGRRYAAAVVVLAAGLSALAQAVYLAGGIGRSVSAPVALRFGVGAWPAIAAALTAHLLHLIATTPTAHPGLSEGERAETLTPTRQPVPTEPRARTDVGPAVQPISPTVVQPYNAPAVQPSTPPLYSHPYSPGLNPPAVQPPRTDTAPQTAVVQPPCTTPAEPPRSRTPEPAPAARPVIDGGGSAAGDRARQAARAHLSRHGDLPTATELMQTAQVSRGTAGTVLKRLRDERPALHIVNANPETDTEQ